LLGALALAGAVASFSLPVALFPQVSFPRVRITLDAGDRPAEQMAVEVTTPVEEAVRAIPGVRNVRSTTSRGTAEISINFDWGEDMVSAMLQSQSQVNKILPSLPAGASFEVEQPAAAVLAIRAKAFVAIGGFDPRFVPAWWEDVDLCFRLGALGKIVYYPKSVFAHGGGAAMRRLGYDRFLPMYYRNAIAYWGKNRGPVAALIFRFLLFKGMLLRMMLLPLRQTDPRPKSESFRAYRRALAVALDIAQLVVRDKPGFDDEKKDLIYNLGSAFESMGKKAEANEQFVMIWESDAGYKDVAAKVDAFYAGQ